MYKMLPSVWKSGQAKTADNKLKYPPVDPKLLNLIASFARDVYWRKYNLQCDAGHKYYMEFLRTLGYKVYTVRFRVIFNYQSVFITHVVEKKPERVRRPSTPEAPMEYYQQYNDINYAYHFDNVDSKWDYGYNTGSTDHHPDYEDWSWNRR